MTSAPNSRRTLGRAAVLLAVVLGAILAGATPAAAHPTLLFTDPATDTAVPDAPPVITLVFNETVIAGPHALTLLDSGGRELPLEATTSTQDGHLVSAKPAAAVQPGTYRVRWQVTGADGDQVEEEFRFAVGTAVTGSAATGGQSTSWGEAALRWLLFAGVAAALGGVLGERFTSSARAESPDLRPPRSQVAPGALLGLAGVVGLAGFLVAGSGTATSLWQSRAGEILLAEALGLTVATGLVIVRGGRWRVWSVVPLVVVVVAEGLRSHANQSATGWGATLTAVHLAAVAVWAGTLLHVVRAVYAWRGVPPAVRWVLAGYLRLAGWVFAVVVITGTISAILLVPLASLATTMYGRVLLVKLLLVAVATGLALTARLASGRGRLDRVRGVTGLETVALVCVLAVSAVLVSTPTAAGQPAGPPPARGLVVPLGTLAGQVGVNVAASDDQVVVRLSTPRRGDYYGPESAQDYQLSGRLATDDASLEFRGCGDGCFVSSMDWKPGDNVLTLRADADGWRGSTVSLLVPWPARPDTGDLARAVQALRAVPQLTVYEAVTSDTTAGPPVPQQLELTGAFFVAQEPYASGVAPVAARISRDGQQVRLALGYPAEATTVTLGLDARGRISDETLSDGTHLIHRRFVYGDS